MRGQSGLEGSVSQEIPQEKDPTYQDRKVAGVGEDGRGRRKAQGREDPTDERREEGERGFGPFPSFYIGMATASGGEMEVSTTYTTMCTSDR